MERTVDRLPAAVWELLRGYNPSANAYDELLTDEGNLRTHYTLLVQSLADLSSDELLRRVETCRRLVHEQGITYNVYGDPRGKERPWWLDSVPLVVSANEWRGIEAGLIQRATLLN